MDERKLGRLTGAIYLIVVVTGLFSLMYVPATLAGDGEPSDRLARLLTHPGLYNAGTAAFLVEQAAFCVLPLMFYRWLRYAGSWQAALMVILALASVPVSLVAAAHRLDAIGWLTDADLLSTVTSAQGHALARMALHQWDHALLIASLFWGLWLAPLGYLIAVSRSLPRLLGWLLMAGSIGYVIDVLGQILWSGYGRSALAGYATLPAALGELGTCVWLLVFGA
jgi:hypothetical protein